MKSIPVSLNEIESTCKKAIRGSGYPWGLAEEGAKANRWLAAKGFPGTESLALFLNQISLNQIAPSKPDLSMPNWCPPGQALCPIMTGCALIDFFPSHGLPSRLDGILFPVQMTGILGMFAERMDTRILVEWENTTVFLARRSNILVGKGVNASLASKVTLKTFESVKGYPVATEIWNNLQRHAEKTHVPASEISRVDAGSATSDND